MVEKQMKSNNLRSLQFGVPKCKNCYKNSLCSISRHLSAKKWTSTHLCVESTFKEKYKRLKRCGSPTKTGSMIWLISPNHTLEETPSCLWRKGVPLNPGGNNTLSTKRRILSNFWPNIALELSKKTKCYQLTSFQTSKKCKHKTCRDPQSSLCYRSFPTAPKHPLKVWCGAQIIGSLTRSSCLRETTI